MNANKQRSNELLLRKALNAESLNVLYANMHSGPPSRRAKYLGNFSYEKDTLKESTALTVVPDNIIVISFEKIGCEATSTVKDTINHLNFLSNPLWMQTTERPELTNNAKIYYPGDIIYNPPQSFDYTDYNVYVVPKIGAEYHLDDFDDDEDLDKATFKTWNKGKAHTRDVRSNKTGGGGGGLPNPTYDWKEMTRAWVLNKLAPLAPHTPTRATPTSGLESGVRIIYLYTCVAPIEWTDFPGNPALIEKFRTQRDAVFKAGEVNFKEYVNNIGSVRTRRRADLLHRARPTRRRGNVKALQDDPMHESWPRRSTQGEDEYGWEGDNAWIPCLSDCTGGSWWPLPWTYDSCETLQGNKNCTKIPPGAIVMRGGKRTGKRTRIKKRKKRCRRKRRRTRRKKRRRRVSSRSRR